MDADANGGHSQSNGFPASGSHLRKNYFPIRKITVFPHTDSQSRKNHFPANGNQLQKNYIMMDADANGGHSQSNSFPASGSHSRKNQNRFPNERQPFVGNL